MTLTIHQKEDEQRQVKLTVAVSEDQVEKAMRQKARELSRELRFQGFRRGKVPYRIVLQRVGRESVRAEAIDDMTQSVFLEALGESGIEPAGQPSFDDLELEPLVLKFTIPLEPVITLGDYRELRKEIEPVVVTDEAMANALEQIQTKHQTEEEVDRPIELGDLVTLGGRGEMEPKAADDVDDSNEDEVQQEDEVESDFDPNLIFDEERVDFVMDGEKVFFGSQFIDNLVGLSAGDNTSFSLTLSEDLEEVELAGREASFDISILDVKERHVPELDDELAKLEGDFETLEELEDNLRDGLQKQAEENAKNELIESTVDDLLEDAELVYPPASVEMEIEEMVQEFKMQISQSGWEFDDFLKIQGTTEESLRDDFQENAENRLRRRLVMRQLILDEKLKVEAADIDAVVDERVSNYESEEFREQMREFFVSGAGFDMISSEVLMNKVYERIQEILTGTAPDLDSLDEEDEEDGSEEE